MKRFLALTAVACLAAAGAGAQPVPVIFDTDMGNDVDDALALAMLHAMQSRGECRLLGVTVTKDNPWAAVYVDLVNTFYGRGQIPVGMVKGSGVTPEGSRMIQAPAERRREDGTLVYPRRLASGAEALDCWLRRRTEVSSSCRWGSARIWRGCWMRRPIWNWSGGR